MRIALSGAVIVGFGSAVMEMAAARGLNAANVRLLGLPDRFIAHATRQEQLTEAGLDAPNIVAMVKDMIQTASAKHQAAKPIRNLI